MVLDCVLASVWGPQFFKPYRSKILSPTQMQTQLSYDELFGVPALFLNAFDAAAAAAAGVVMMMMH